MGQFGRRVRRNISLKAAYRMMKAGGADFYRNPMKWAKIKGIPRNIVRMYLEDFGLAVGGARAVGRGVKRIGKAARKEGARGAARKVWEEFGKQL